MTYYSAKKVSYQHRSCSVDGSYVSNVATGMGGRTVQKYIEFPLLAPVPNSGKLDDGAACMKFDTRIWVLVTSFKPLQAHIFPTIYGRRCGTAYSTDLSTLGDSYAHLTNYSVQKKQSFTGENSPVDSCNHGSPVNSAAVPQFDSHAAGKLRNVIRKYRGGSDGNGGANITAVRPQQGQSGKGGDATPSQGKAQIAESDLLMCKWLVLCVLFLLLVPTHFQALRHGALSLVAAC
jgi:hypothetical protein